MAAVQQRSPTEPLTPTSPKNANFIANMEDEVKRCAEHLERRQSRKGYRSLERKANGYSSTSGVYFESSSSAHAGRSHQTLPGSFAMPSDPEERSVLSPPTRAMPPARSPLKSPAERSVFKFNHSHSVDAPVYPRQQQVRDDPDRLPAGYHKGNSAPPEATPFFSAGSGSCSRDSSVTPLQSPLGRTPIGAVASHSRSRRSSYSSSSPPPPAVPPKRQSASPPTVPPKPAGSRPRRAKSHTPPSPNRSHTPHKVTVTSVRRDSLTLSSPPPPMDPDLVSKLSAEEHPRKDRIEFPSAEVDVTFHDRVEKAKSLLKASTEGEVVCSYGIESSVDAEDYNEPVVLLRELSAPPSLGSVSAELGTAAGLGVARARVLSGAAGSSNYLSEAKGRSNPEAKLHASCTHLKVNSSGTESSVDIVFSERPEASEGPKESAGHTHAISSDLSLDDPGSCPSISDTCTSKRESGLSVEDGVKEEGVTAAASSKAVEPDGRGTVAGVEEGEEEVEQKVEELLDKLSEKTLLSSTSSSSLPVMVSPEAEVEGIGGEKGREEEKEEGRGDVGSGESLESLNTDSGGGVRIVATGGMGSDDLADEVFIMPASSLTSVLPGITSPAITSPAAAVDNTPVDSTGVASQELEVKSVSAVQSLKAANKRRGSPHKNSQHSMEHREVPGSPGKQPGLVSEQGIVSSVDKPSTEAQTQREGVGPEGASESVALLIKELQIQLREKEEDLGRLQRQKDRELKEKDEKVKKLTRDAKKVEREKWELLKRARDAAERSLHLRTQLDVKEGALRSVQSELDRTRDELVSVKSANTSLRALLGDLRASRPSVDVGVQADLGTGTLRRNRSIELAFSQGGMSQEQDGTEGFDSRAEARMSSSSLGLHWPERWDRDGMSMESASLQDLGRDSSYQPLGSRESRKSRKKGALLSKMMRSSGRRGSRSSIASIDGLDLSQSSLIQGAGHAVINVGAPYQAVSSDLKEHWRTLEDAKGTPFMKWGLKVLVAWMEAELGMGQYSRAMADKFPSAGSLLALSEGEMDKKLGISNGLHRRKLMLALQEKKAPQLSRCPHASKIDHSWVAFEWAHDCGLAHLTEAITNHLIDGRVLNTLTKDDLKRFLKLTKKVDQMSFLSGVELLRMHEFNREAIQEHRRSSKNPLYWTNRDVADWLHRIDLQDYANNVIGGGVHGALLFLERGRFTSEHLSNIIQIPTSKNQLRRHLAGKIASLFSEDIGGYVSHDQPHRHLHLATPLTTPPLLPADIGGSLDPLPIISGALAFSNSPLDLSPSNNGSQSPPRGSHSQASTHSGMTTPTDCLHPSRRNSLSRRSMQLSPIHNLVRPVTSSPPSLKRTGSTPLSVRNAAGSPHHFQRNQPDSAERVRNSLRESALRSMREEPPPHSNRTATPTILSTTNRTATPTILSSTTV